MKTKGIQIDIEGNGDNDVLFPDILLEIRNGESLHWSIQFIKGWRYTEEGKVYVCDKGINDSERGLLLNWNELVAYTEELFDLEEICVIGCKDESLVKRYKDDSEMFETCDVSMDVIDRAYWEVFSKDESLIHRLSDKFTRYKLLDSDFLKTYISG